MGNPNCATEVAKDKDSAGRAAVADERTDVDPAALVSSAHGQSRELQGAADGGLCDPAVLDHSDPDQPADEAAILANAGAIKVSLERLRDDVAAAILAHNAAATQVAEAYALAWERYADLAQSDKSTQRGMGGVPVAVLNLVLPDAVGWFLGRLFDSSGSAMTADVRALQGLMRSVGLGKFKAGGKRAKMPSGPVRPALFSAQVAAATAGLAADQNEVVMAWLHGLRPIEDTPAAYPWFAQVDVSSIQRDVAAWRAQSPLMAAPEAVDVAALADQYERWLWANWLLKNHARSFMETEPKSPYSIGGGASYRVDTLSDLSDAVIERVDSLGLGQAEKLDRVFNGDALRALHSECIQIVRGGS